MLQYLFSNKVCLLIFFAFLSSFLAPKIHGSVISPDKYFLEVTSAEVVKPETLTIYSTPNQTETLYYKISTIGIKKVGEENQRTFYTPDPNDAAEPANWIQILDTVVEVAPGSSAVVRWQARVPNDYFCKTTLSGITVSKVENPVDNIGETVITIGDEVISQVHINAVRADDPTCRYYENLFLQEFKVDSTIPVFNYDNIEFKTTIENRSEYIARNLKGFIEIIGFGGKEVVEFNDTNLDIYPNSIRIFSNLWIDKNYPRGNFFEEILYEINNFKFGIYNVRLGITKNIEAPIISSTQIFIIPYRIILLIVVVIVLLVLFLRNIYFTREELNEIKKKNKHNS